MMKTISAIVPVILLFFIFNSPVAAQADTDSEIDMVIRLLPGVDEEIEVAEGIQYGEIISGKLIDVDDSRAFVFRGLRFDVGTIIAFAFSDNNLEIGLSRWDPHEGRPVIIGFLDDTQNNEIELMKSLNFILPEDGIYVIEVFGRRNQDFLLTLINFGEIFASEVSSGEVGAVLLTSAMIERMVSIDRVEVANCNSETDLVSRRAFSRETVRSLTYLEADRVPELLGRSFGAGIDFDFLSSELQAEVTAEVRAFANIPEDEEPPLSGALELQITVPAGAQGVYVIEWFEISNVGLVEIIAGSETRVLPFAIVNSLDPRTREPIVEPCQ